MGGRECTGIGGTVSSAFSVRLLLIANLLGLERDWINSELLSIGYRFTP